jgi:hypothetical protein
MDPTIQLTMAMVVPTLAVLIGILLNNSRFNDLNHRINGLRTDVDRRFEGLEKLFTERLLRVEQVLDARLTNIEQQLHLR